MLAGNIGTSRAHCQQTLFRAEEAVPQPPVRWHYRGITPLPARQRANEVGMFPPERIVCLTEETTETLYLLGEEHRIVGISGYTVRPPQARKDKPRVSAFVSADIPKILALEPDLVLAFSDLQAEIVAALVHAGVCVHAFNQRTVAGILDMIRMLGALVGAGQRAEALVERLAANLDVTKRRSAERGERPKVYFEEWDEPMISGIAWVSELIAIAGGVDIFPELAGCKSAKDRIATPEAVIARAPDIIIGSWCGKKFSKEKVAARPGFDSILAVRNGKLYEIKSALILQPGPAALTDGLLALETIIRGVP
jgi:iron complex transport system substrate-binding protein